MKATTKHAAAASKHGIMITPNQPTYNLLLVEVTHSQNCGQPASRLFCLRIFEVVILLRRLNRASRVEAIFISCNPSLQDIKDEVLYCLQRSWLGAVCLGGRSFRVLCVVLKTTPLFIYINISLHTCQRVCVRFGIFLFNL